MFTRGLTVLKETGVSEPGGDLSNYPMCLEDTKMAISPIRASSDIDLPMKGVIGAFAIE